MRFSGEVGYGESVEDTENPGDWVTRITRKPYFGDVIRNTRQLSSGEKINSDISLGNSISIVADPYAYDNFVNIVFVSWVGKLWTVTDVEVQSPRLILSIGSIYNGPTE